MNQQSKVFQEVFSFPRVHLSGFGPTGSSVEIRNTKVLPPSSRRQATPHRGVAFSHSNLSHRKKAERVNSLDIRLKCRDSEHYRADAVQPASGKCPPDTCIYFFESRHKRKKQKEQMLFLLFGPSVEIRTRGLLNPIQARYQTSPHPDIVGLLTTSV